ncbi:hypothetical protein BpHYR1_012692 [Brachionus plicatilis]|uniref:Uncharacterized protein n=1 Tax=Brachionus plicatilis TaxID=10195 RepID=A0A3M7SNE0_BRAPC|nr:hypothetical protein BpHYR1_012692 [Brachionus plicatilis]
MIIASVKIIELISKYNILFSKNDYPITELNIGGQNYFLANYNNNTTSFEQRISYYRSDDTDVEGEEIEAPVYKKTRGVGKIYDPHGTFETESETRGPGRPKNAKRALIKQKLVNKIIEESEISRIELNNNYLIVEYNQLIDDEQRSIKEINENAALEDNKEKIKDEKKNGIAESIKFFPNKEYPEETRKKLVELLN